MQYDAGSLQTHLHHHSWATNSAPLRQNASRCLKCIEVCVGQPLVDPTCEIIFVHTFFVPYNSNDSRPTTVSNSVVTQLVYPESLKLLSLNTLALLKNQIFHVRLCVCHLSLCRLDSMYMLIRRKGTYQSIHESPRYRAWKL